MGACSKQATDAEGTAELDGSMVSGRTGFAAGSIRAESIGAESIGAEPIGAEPIRLIVSRPGKPSLFLGSDSADSAVRSAIVNMYEFPGNPESCWFEELRDGAAPQWMPRKPAVRGYTPDDWEDSPASRVAGSGSNQRRRATLAAGGAGYLLEAAWATPRAEMVTKTLNAPYKPGRRFDPQLIPSRQNPAARPTAPAPEYELHDDYEDDEDEDDAGHDDGDGGDSGDDDAADLRDNLPVKPEAMVRNGPPLKKGWSGACATMHDNLIHEPISLMSLVSQPEAPRDETGKFRIGAMRLYAGMRNGDKCGYCTLRGLRAAATQRTGMGMYGTRTNSTH
ncbi:hypothetical protein UVI_02016020 [Ustilaginoidea virens]|uniref:Uncharacterized protein n=1 Tax=Ustilaginoidea virens TaxID=1159556 RepID=A0A1B5KRT9_USTVR|nr:hypothetical protein UVI_02016020 [Ustilaginoidea virens]